MSLLLDTHAFLWLVSADPRLSSGARDLFLDRENEVFISAATFWEIGIKVSLGKLELAPGWPEMFREEMEASSIGWLAIELAHCVALSRLPFHHRDPFDRMLIAQAQVHRLAVISRDENLRRYEIEVVW